MKKKIAAIALVVCMAAIAIIGATMAYFTDNAQKTNTFTFGKVDIDLTETSTADDTTGVKGGEVDPDTGGITYGSVLPGVVYSKVPTVTVAADSSDAWIVVTAKLPTAYVDAADPFDGSVDTANFDVATAIDGEYTVYYFYAKAVTTATHSLTPFTKIKVNSELTQGATLPASFTVDVNAYAIQADGFTSAKDAYRTAVSSTAP